MLEFRFDEAKAVQAVACLLKTSRCRCMSVLKLMKLLYLADRESIAETGHPITGDRVVAMDFGPVLSSIYDLLKDCDRHPAASKFVRKRMAYYVELVGDPGDGRLCPYEVEKLSELGGRFHDKDPFELVDLTHEFPEWAKNRREGTSTPIPVEDILEAVGRQDAASDIEDEMSEDEFFARAFGQ